MCESVRMCIDLQQATRERDFCSFPLSLLWEGLQGRRRKKLPRPSPLFLEEEEEERARSPLPYFDAAARQTGQKWRRDSTSYKPCMSGKIFIYASLKDNFCLSREASCCQILYFFSREFFLLRVWCRWLWRRRIPNPEAEEEEGSCLEHALSRLSPFLPPFRLLATSKISHRLLGFNAWLAGSLPHYTYPHSHQKHNVSEGRRGMMRYRQEIRDQSKKKGRH